jgi:hypothetical protein
MVLVLVVVLVLDNPTALPRFFAKNLSSRATAMMATAA